jgi:hypothetical protein
MTTKSAAPVSAVTTVPCPDVEPAALLGVVAAPPPFELAVAVVRCRGADGDREAVGRYLDRLDDTLLCAVCVYWPGGKRTAPEMVRGELWSAGHRRRQARGWSDWPPEVMRSAAELAGRPAGNAEDTHEADR